MRWIKHMTNARRDPVIAEAIERFGDAGYRVFFTILEMMGENIDLKMPGKLVSSWTVVCQELNKRPTSLKRILTYYAEKKKFAVEWNDTDLIVYCPKFKEFADPYTERKLREKYALPVPGSTDKVRSLCVINRTDKIKDSGGEARDKQHTPAPDDAAAPLEEGGASDGLLRNLVHKIFQRRKELGLDPKTGRGRQ